MKNALIVAVALLGFAQPAAALDVEAITSRPTADNPQYENKEAWPTLVGDEYFQKEKWEKARLLIWNVGGSAKTIPGRHSGFDGLDPANWINAATGQPAKSIPDMDTDVILPDSDEPYRVNFHNPKGARAAFCRHMTVGRNTTILLAGHPHKNSIRFLGNVWVRATGKIVTYGHMHFIGGHDTFLRQDWPEDGKLKRMHDERLVAPYDPAAKSTDHPWVGHGHITYFLIHDKAEGKSTEVVGYVSAVDEVRITSGTFVVGRDSRFVTTGPASISVNKGARVVLMDGAHCSHGQNQFVNRDWNVAAGAKVTGGTPDRPLQRDAYFGLGYRNWRNLPVPQRESENRPIPTTANGTRLYYGYGGYNAIVYGDLIGHPAPDSDARLVVCWQRISSGGAGAWGRTDAAFNKVFATIPPKIGIWIGSDAHVENVRFDDLQPGGIVTKDMEAFETWKNVSFGDGCLRREAKALVRGYEAELAEMGGRHKSSVLPPKKQYTTP